MFNVKLTADFFDASGRTKYHDIGLSVLSSAPEILHAPFAEHRAEIGADQLAGANGVIVLTPKVTAATVSQSQDLVGIGRARVVRGRHAYRPRQTASGGRSWAGLRAPAPAYR